MEKLVKRIAMNDEEKKLVDEIESFIRQYEMLHHLNMVKVEPDICTSLNLSRGDMAELSAEDSLHHAYMIATHMNKLTTEFNQEKVKLRFVRAAYRDAINHFLGVMEFRDYTAAETKEQLICESHTDAFKIRELMRKIETVIQLYEDKFFSLKKMSDILYQLSREK